MSTLGVDDAIVNLVARCCSQAKASQHSKQSSIDSPDKSVCRFATSMGRIRVGSETAKRLTPSHFPIVASISYPPPFANTTPAQRGVGVRLCVPHHTTPTDQPPTMRRVWRAQQTAARRDSHNGPHALSVPLTEKCVPRRRALCPSGKVGAAHRLARGRPESRDVPCTITRLRLAGGYTLIYTDERTTSASSWRQYTAEKTAIFIFRRGENSWRRLTRDDAFRSGMQRTADSRPVMGYIRLRMRTI